MDTVQMEQEEQEVVDAGERHQVALAQIMAGSSIPEAPEYNSLTGREPGRFGYPTCLNTSSRQATGGAIGESQLPWPHKLTNIVRVIGIRRDGVGVTSLDEIHYNLNGN